MRKYFTTSVKYFTLKQQARQSEGGVLLSSVVPQRGLVRDEVTNLALTKKKLLKTENYAQKLMGASS